MRNQASECEERKKGDKEKSRGLKTPEHDKSGREGTYLLDLFHYGDDENKM